MATRPMKWGMDWDEFYATYPQFNRYYTQGDQKQDVLSSDQVKKQEGDEDGVQDTKLEEAQPDVDGNIDEHEEEQNKTLLSIIEATTEIAIKQQQASGDEEILVTGPRKDCFICCDELVVNQFPPMPNADAHDHEQNVCSGCWEQYLSVRIKDKDGLAVMCAECREQLSEVEIKKLASRNVYIE